ncbi:urease accessory protein UreE [soil metagenome]
MIRATRVLPKGQWSGAPVDTVTLDYDQRHRRRHAMTGASGTDFLLDLAEAIPLRDGDALELEDRRIVAIKAAPEPLAEITASGPNHLLRVAWHLGNRHLPTEALADRLRIRRDHVIEEMVAGLEATVRHVVEPFNPEGGAYAHPAVHHHRHHHEDAPSLAHDDRLDEGTARRG